MGSQTMSRVKSFSDDFLFGVSTAAYQIEGGWNADGKGENIWDRLVHTRPELIRNKENADISCDSYHLFKEDVSLIKELGFQVYRFSISWARILPNGEITCINEAGVNYYHALIDELLANGIQPMVTMYHWDLPQRLQDMGGWLNPLIIDYMEDYADLLFQLYGEKVKLWITINEPASIVGGYADQEKNSNAPALYLDSPANYIVTYNLLRAHARVYRLYDKKFRTVQNGKVAISLDTSYYEAIANRGTDDEDKQATERAWAFNLEIYAHPIFSEEGDFPEIVKTIVDENSEKEGRKRSRLPKFTDHEIESLKGSSDFFGLNHYSSWLCSHAEPPFSSLIDKDRRVKLEIDPHWPTSHANYAVVPYGFRQVLCFIKNKYDNPQVFVTESGYCSKPGILDDADRVKFYQDYLQELFEARETYNCNVIGYITWSILDNFEWNDSYDFCYGIVDVDFKDPKRKRTQKSSAKFFKQMLKTRSIPESV